MNNFLEVYQQKNKFYAATILSLVILFIGFFAEFYAVTPFLSLLSSILIIIIIFSIVVYGGNFLINPLSIFSLMYMGYAFGGYYYAFSDGDFGKFLSYLNLSRWEVEQYLVYAIFYVILSYIFFVLGFSIFYKKNGSSEILKYTSGVGIFKYYKVISFSLIFVGLVYWVWLCYALAGGIIQMLFYFQAFRHLIADAELTSLPFHLYYAGVFFWLIASTVIYKKVSYFFIFFSFLGLIIGLSTGRITLSFTYLMAQMIYYYYYFPFKRSKITLILIFTIFLAFSVFFLRFLSNQYFIGEDLGLSDQNFFSTIISGGNITDLQQLVIIFKTFDSSNSLLGITYLDFIRNTLGVMFGYEPHSIGLLIKEVYIPSTSGAPTPGAIGEAYANFLFCGPIIMFMMGSIFSYIYMRVSYSRNTLVIMVYAIFLARFVFMYPKVDSTMMINFLWGAMPLIIIWLLAQFILVLVQESR